VIVIDSSGWIEYFTDGPSAKDYARRMRDPGAIVTPSIVVYEVYKVVKRQRSEEDAMIAAAAIQRTRVIPLDTELALEAADLGIQHRLAMADAIVLATARQFDAILYTGDRDFEGIEGVVVIPKSEI
jgi:predicted nucleic acid-binding protein